MNEILIQDTNENQLRFQGELVIESEKVFSLDDRFERKFMAKIYAVMGGGYVSSLQYVTSSPAEKPILIFEEIDFMDDVEKFYYVFEPGEIFSDSLDLPRELIEQRPALGRQMAKQYESMVFALLDDFRVQVTQRGFLDKPNDQGTPKKSSFWSSLGRS